MAKKTIEKFYSDLSDEEIADDYSPVSFAFSGIAYEIDLTSSEKEEFVNVLRPYMDAARPAGRTASIGRRTGSKYEPKVVRAWATENGIDVPARGRIPRDVLDAFAASR